MIDIIIILLYLIILLVISIKARTTGQNFKEFASASQEQSNSKLLLTATIFASSIGGGTTFGITEKVFTDNIAYSVALLMVIPIDILIAKYIVPRIVNHHGAETIGDIISVYYGKIGRIIAGFSTLASSIGFLAAQISVSGRIFEYILNINYIYGVIFSYIIVIIYTTIGGFRSVLHANKLQFFAIILAIPTISMFGIYEIGYTNFLHKIPMHKISFFHNNELLPATIYAILGFSVMNMFPSFIQRTLISKDYKKTQSAIYIKSAIYMCFMICVTINGLIAYIIYPEMNANLAFPHLINHIIPTGLQGMVIVGLLAAVMSTADSDLNITSITIVKDFLEPIFKIHNQYYKLVIARISNLVIGILAIIISLYFTKIADLVILISGFWGSIILIPLIFALFNITIHRYNFIISCICGLSAFIIWENYFTHDLTFKGVFIGAMCNFIMFTLFWFAFRYKRNN